MSLRSNFEPGTTRWAVRRAQWRAMGIPAEDIDKPKIAVVNSSSQLSVCYQHLDGVSQVVQDAVRAAGGLPFEISTVAPSDFVTSAGREARYLMPSRDLIVNDIEVAVEGAVLDGMVTLASCDKTTPAHLMAAGRLNVPSIVVICGYQTGGLCDGRHIDIDDVYESVGTVVAGRMSVDELQAMTECAITGPGVCAGLGTANTMHILCEALGMAMPGSAPVRADSEPMWERAWEAGRRVVQLVVDDIRPRSVMTAQAIENAVVAALAVSGSVNAARHLQAIAVETGLDVDVYALIERRSTDVPQLCGIRPNGLHRVEDLERAGGTRALLRQLAARLHLAARSVSGHTLGELCAAAEVLDEDVVRPLDRPFSPRPGLTLVRGSLAPQGALVKLAAVPEERLVFKGPARVYDSELAAIAALGTHEIAAGDAVVLRGLGPLGGPGTVFAAGFVAALNGAGLASDVAVVTDGELSGLNRGLIVGQVMPEAAEGGPLALVTDGDAIAIDLDACTVDLDVPGTELATRRHRWTPPIPLAERSWLAQYQQLVRPLTEGAVLGAVPPKERT
ncbi:MAG: dihydroxy-acid dehydratase [Acidimicrobiales bacterium]